jgi:anthranilate synthase component 2
VQEALAMKPEAIVLSPGPLRPRAGGHLPVADAAAAGAGMPLFGVCLGHQAIGEAFGGTVVRHSEIVHGKLGQITMRAKACSQACPPRSWRRATIRWWWSATACPRSWRSRQSWRTARSWACATGASHRGVQFHPESIRSEHGHALLKNFLTRAAEAVPA